RRQAGRPRAGSKRPGAVSGGLLRRRTQGAEARCGDRGRVPPGGGLPVVPAGVVSESPEERDSRDGVAAVPGDAGGARRAAGSQRGREPVARGAGFAGGGGGGAGESGGGEPAAAWAAGVAGAGGAGLQVGGADPGGGAGSGEHVL